ncbi:MAG: hypothetical protein PWQ51_1255 [Methanolobus sp.]|jgi:LPXTG-motif cell wall-anchored protein|nr:hypothetical protein [Methanolobus sp.]MDK2939091.1 hypothetical protein [Methanolobus sp.]
MSFLEFVSDNATSIIVGIIILAIALGLLFASKKNR